MDSKIYSNLKREYEIKKLQKEEDALSYKNKVFSENEILHKLDEKKNMLAIKSAKLMLISDDITRRIEKENLEIKLKEIDAKIEKELKRIRLSMESFNPKYDCNLCKDTGIIKNKGKYEICSCFNQALINETYKQSNMKKLDEENFETFDIGYYSKKVDKEKYGVNKSPFEVIENIKNIAYKFATNLDNKSVNNLMFIGNTGLGKTFLANAIANEAIKNGKTVVYQTAPILMDKIMDYRFSYDKTSNEKEQYNKIFEVDLLIIDDLGTETMTNNKFTELFKIINTRLLDGKKILISTNLTLNELYKRYEERVLSRIIGNFNICRFIGEDIRLKKKSYKKNS